VTGLEPAASGFTNPVGIRYFHLYKKSRISLGPTYPPMQWVKFILLRKILINEYGRFLQKFKNLIHLE